MKGKLLAVLLIPVFALSGTPIDGCFAFLKAGDLKIAVSEGKKAVKIYPRNRYAYLCFGEAYQRSGMLDLPLKASKRLRC